MSGSPPLRSASPGITFGHLRWTRFLLAQPEYRLCKARCNCRLIQERERSVTCCQSACLLVIPDRHRQHVRARFAKLGSDEGGAELFLIRHVKIQQHHGGFQIRGHVKCLGKIDRFPQELYGRLRLQ
jgi:hypothetical protein